MKLHRFWSPSQTSFGMSRNALTQRYPKTAAMETTSVGDSTTLINFDCMCRVLSRVSGEVKRKIGFITSNNQRSEKCVRHVLLLCNWDLRVFSADHQLQTWS